MAWTSINSTAWTADTGKTKYYTFQFQTTISKLTATTEWELWTAGADTQSVYGECVLYINDATVLSVPRASRNSNVKLGSGSFTTSLSTSNGTGSFSLQLDGQWYVKTNNCNISKTTQTITGGWSNISSPSVTVADNDNNTFTISGRRATNGTNNTINNSYCYYTIDGTTPSPSNYYRYLTLGTESNTNFSFTLNVPSGSSSRKINVKAYATGAQGDSVSSNTAWAIVYYYSPPSNPSGLAISYNTSKPTKRSAYTFQWDNSTGGYNNSVASYNFQLYKNYALIKSLSALSPISFTGAELSVTKGDVLYFRVQAVGSSGYNSSYSTSPTITIQSSGILRIKVDGSWKEGQVWIKVNGTWKQASDVFIKDGGSWKTSY